MSCKSWYAVHCEARKEDMAAAAFQTQFALEVCYPQVHQRRQGRLRTIAFFPGYLFVHTDLAETGQSCINALPGVRRLLVFGTAPPPIAADVIAAIQAQVRHINDTGGLPRRHFVPGQAVQVSSGPFAGSTALFLGAVTARERVRVLLEFLGRPLEVQLDSAAIESQAPGADPLPSNCRTEPQRVRGTRGRGRVIRSAAPVPEALGSERPGCAPAGVGTQPRVPKFPLSCGHTFS